MGENEYNQNSVYFRVDDRIINVGDYVNNQFYDSTFFRNEGIPTLFEGKTGMCEGFLLFKTEKDARDFNVGYKGWHLYKVHVDPNDIIPNTGHVTEYVVIGNEIRGGKEQRHFVSPIAPQALHVIPDAVCFVRKARVIK